jgi:hypothetical protein
MPLDHLHLMIHQMQMVERHHQMQMVECINHQMQMVEWHNVDISTNRYDYILYNNVCEYLLCTV